MFAFHILSVKWVFQKMIVPPCINVAQDGPQYSFCISSWTLHYPQQHQVFTLEKLQLIQNTSVHRSNFNYFPQCIIVCLSSVNFICHYVAQSSNLLNPLRRSPSPLYFLAWFHHLIIQLIFQILMVYIERYTLQTTKLLFLRLNWILL